ncbi:MAG TPA: SusC/RagA family TonB-linked outer membrane protein, partial [Ohtaekwangia sp.]|uniref:SusC/RagA family TonB-linked outer membrane protein n=1 Tax=Ohtaekwangia sp. TaxID=2066019 RepID=UPI002F939FB6
MTNFYRVRPTPPAVPWHHRLPGIVWIVCLLSVFLSNNLLAEHVHQAAPVIELDLKDASLKMAIREIERQTDYHFVVNDSRLKTIKKNVTISIRSENIEEILALVLEGTNITYKIKKKQITLIPPPAELHISPLTTTGGGSSAMLVQARKDLIFTGILRQDIVVKGVVREETGEPLPGVSVLVKGSSIGTTTDANGEFSLNVPSGESILVFSFIGFTTQEVAVNNQTSLNVTLLADTQTLTEVVVVGYGTQEKKDVTGSISAIKGSDIENLPSGGAQQALQGRMAGVNIVRSGGAPGNAGSIRIRGIGTVGYADPLIVVDGVPTSSTMNDINPNDIQSIDVLKDASASAIYGTRAANGVVLVTTKRGKFDDKLKFTVNAYTGISNRIKTIDVLDAPTLTALKHEAYTNDGLTIPDIWNNTQYQTQKTNWQNEVFKQGTTNNIDLSLRGGGKYSSFAISGGKYDERGIIGKAYYKRYTLRINTDHKVSERLKIGQSLQFTNTHDNAPNTLSAQDGLLWSAIRFHPGLPVRKANGEYSSSLPGFGDINNPVYTIDTQDKDNTRNRILGSATGEYQVIEGLKVKANLALDATFADFRQFEVKIDSQYRQSNYNQLTISNDKNWSFLQEYFISYDKQFGAHAIGFVGGYTSQTYKDIYSKEVGRDFPSEDPSMRYMSQAATVVNLGADNGGRVYTALQSWFGRATYSYKDRYLLTATYRADGSSRFRNGLRWGYFPAFSLGWRVSEEAFFESALPIV